MKKIAVLAAIVFGGMSFSAQTFAQDTEKEEKKECIQVLINGRQAAAEDIEKLPAQSIQQMHYLHGRDAINLLGLAGAGGVLLVKTSSQKELLQPVVLKEGARISIDSLERTSFSRIDVIRGQQALNLYGPGAAGGVLLVHQDRKEEPAEEEMQGDEKVKERCKKK